MKIVLTGSIAFDYLMTFPGQFKEHILLEQLERLSLSFLVDSLERRHGGIATNIAYTLALLEEQPTVMATAGKDFDSYRQMLQGKGVDTSAIRTIPDLFTASFFATTDETNAQIASFYPGAMVRAKDLRFEELPNKPDLAVISANDPEAMEVHIDECSQLGIPFYYDPSQQTVRMDAATMTDGIERCRALFVNDYEFSLIEEKTGLDVDQMLQNSDFIVITKGELGAEVHTAEGCVQVDAARPRQIVDPTGVGDAFRAGFLKGILSGFEMKRCAQLGSIAATYCLEHEGPQGHEFTLDRFIDRFRRHFDDEGDLDSLK